MNVVIDVIKFNWQKMCWYIRCKLQTWTTNYIPLLFVPKQQRRMADATTESAVAEQVVTNATTTASATTTPPQHGLHGAIQQPHPSVIPMAPQQPSAVMAGSYPPATYPNVFHTAQSGTVQFMQPPQPALQPQTQVSPQIDCNASHDHFILTCFSRPSRERHSLCIHLNLLYNHKHKWVHKLIAMQVMIILS